MLKKRLFLFLVVALPGLAGRGQITDSVHIPSPVEVHALSPVEVVDTNLRITNLNPYFTLHVDSMLSYQLTINKDESRYHWYLKNSPVGLKINKDNGLMTFKADKSFFLSGKLKYDAEYSVKVGVQSLADPNEKVDTSFTLVFYNTDVILPKIKPTVGSTLTVDEGETVSFKLQCEDGNFPIESILFYSNVPLQNYKPVKSCDDEFSWTPPFDFVKETDSAKVKIVTMSFVGSTKFKVKDTANVRIIVKDALNYPVAKQEYDMMASAIRSYILRLKYTFLQLDKKLKKTKNVRTTFDLTSASTALTGTILSTTSNTSSQNAGKILPSVGLALVPVKEASAPNKVVEQNQASLVRSSIKRLEYMLYDYTVVGDKDPNILTKTAKLKEELKQSQMQLIDVPTEDIMSNMTEEELNNYFNSPKVNKKYRLTGK